jgi:asparagine synthase (glutamine-hydrolysing)
MGGITGCLALADGAGPDTEWVDRAALRVAHRGPDDQGSYADADLALAFRRLAVIDPSPRGRQPIASADGRYVMVFDGEIYNHIELAGRLAARGVQLRSRSGAEVLLEMYAWLGKDVVRQLRGMYAFAIWDRRNRELFCARDPFGIKPFFYALTPGSHRPRSGPQLRFASERKALADAGEVKLVDPDALRRYLSFQYVPAPATMVPPARALPPGHVLIARPGGRVDVFRYWRPEFKPARSPSSASPGKILDALRDSVAVHLRSDVPVGAFLSGGVDSATLCALAAESIPGLLTFTVGFDREGYSEIDHAAATATALGVKSIPYVITPEEFFDCLPQIVWQLDDPMADAAAVPLWFAAREARKHVKVVLSGEGADELFGGYGVYYQPGVVRAGKALPGWSRATIGRVAAELPTGARGKGLLNRTSTPLRRRYIGNAFVFHGEEASQLVRGASGSAFDVTDPVYRQAAEAGLDDVATMQLVDVNTWLPGDILVKADRMAMAHGLELRTPFLDREVLAVAAKLARPEKTAAGTTKFALREAVGDLLPQAAAERAKLGFPVPLGHWLRGGMFGYAEHAVGTAQTGQWLNKNAALDLLRRFRAGEPDVTWRQVWLLVVFSLWHQIYVERVYDPVTLGWEPTPPPTDPARTAYLADPARPALHPSDPGRPALHPSDPGRTAAYPGPAADPGRTAAYPAPAEAHPGPPHIFTGSSDQHSGPPDIFSPTTDPRSGPRPAPHRAPPDPHRAPSDPHRAPSDPRPSPPRLSQDPAAERPSPPRPYEGPVSGPGPYQDPAAERPSSPRPYQGPADERPGPPDRYPGAPDQRLSPPDQDPDVTDQYADPQSSYPDPTDPYSGRPGR